MASGVESQDGASTVRHQLMDRLQRHAGLSSATTQQLRDFIVAADYFSYPNHCGGLLAPGHRHYFADGSEHTFDDVPLAKIVKAVTEHIEKHTDGNRRTDIYHQVLAGVPGHKLMPDWDRPAVNPNEQPLTPFSVKTPPVVMHWTWIPVSNV